MWGFNLVWDEDFGVGEAGTVIAEKGKGKRLGDL